MKITIRTYVSSDAPLLTDIFYDTVHGLAGDLYTEDQIDAWAPLPRDYAAWKTRLDKLQPYVAEADGKPLGFMTLEPDGHIDLAYTHRDYQRTGIASVLYAYLERAAMKRGIGALRVEASHYARAFFLSRNFSIVRRNEIHKNGQRLINWKMVKLLV